MTDTETTTWTDGIWAITLFVDDLAATRQFYLDVFSLPILTEDDDSAVFKFGATMINLLKSSEAPELIEPALVAPADAGSRSQLTLLVGDVDAKVEELKAKGVEILNGPADRPWGMRTAAFRDPGGQVWELAQ